MPAGNTIRSRALAFAITVLIHVLTIFLVLSSMAIRNSRGLAGGTVNTAIEVSILPAVPASRSPRASLRAHQVPLPQPQPPQLKHRTEAPMTALTVSEPPLQKTQLADDDIVIGAVTPDFGDPNDFRQRLLAYLAQFENYPLEARARRIEGNAILAFTLARNGTVSNLRIARSSGSAILDRAAEDTVLRAEPLPLIPADLSDPLEIELPIEFTMRP